ncbi:MAG: hypothetical protein HYZ54_06160 [Ignavibacteriae bacterium]|nr:hypothetical protein [Ignavibacteriota bacterium]
MDVISPSMTAGISPIDPEGNCSLDELNHTHNPIAKAHTQNDDVYLPATHNPMPNRTHITNAIAKPIIFHEIAN